MTRSPNGAGSAERIVPARDAIQSLPESPQMTEDNHLLEIARAATAGPWHVSAAKPNVVIAPWGDGAAGGFSFSCGTHENARLVAAAPDLLAALSDIVKPNGYDAGGRDGMNLARARAAMAKATGQ